MKDEHRKLIDDELDTMCSLFASLLPTTGSVLVMVVVADEEGGHHYSRYTPCPDWITVCNVLAGITGATLEYSDEVDVLEGPPPRGG